MESVEVVFWVSVEVIVLDDMDRDNWDSVKKTESDVVTPGVE